MTEHDPLIAACCAAPDSDAPRLVYADWLDDSGDASRAELIRLQCADSAGVTFRMCEVRSQLPDPIDGFRVHANPASYNSSPFVPRGLYRRGFVAEIECPAAWWAEHGDALSWHPAEARPCPATACPGLVVRLTTPVREGIWPRLLRPERSFIVGEWGSFYAAVPEELPHNSPEAITAALSARWPGVRAWHLPPTTPRGQYAHWGEAAGGRVARSALVIGGPLDGDEIAFPGLPGSQQPPHSLLRVPEPPAPRAGFLAPEENQSCRVIEYRLEHYRIGRRRIPVYIAAGVSAAEAEAVFLARTAVGALAMGEFTAVELQSHQLATNIRVPPELLGGDAGYNYAAAVSAVGMARAGGAPGAIIDPVPAPPAEDEPPDACDHCGAAADVSRAAYTRAMYDGAWLCDDCHAQARMED